MFNKKFLKSVVLSCLLVSFSNANDKFTMDEMLNEVIKKDSEIQERLYQFESIVQEVEMSKAGYLPKLDLIGRSGKKNTKSWDQKETDNYDYSDGSLKAVQNIFDGFGTTHATNRDIARAKAAYNKYLEVAQDKMKRAIVAYIEVIKYGKLVKITEDNIKIHEKIKEKVDERYKKGYGTKSELERVTGRLSLAISNHVSAKSNYADAKIKFRKALDKNVDAKDLETPNFKYALPNNFDEALQKSIKNNPSMLVAEHDKEVSKEALEYAKRNNYPTLDVELEATRYNNKNGSDVDSRDEDYSAMLVMNYNLYNGGKDQAEKLKYKSLQKFEAAHKQRLEDELKESLDFAWNSYVMLNEQLTYQKDYQKYTENSKEAYFEEFQLGRKSLIDLLDIQDEINSIRMQITANEYEILISKYRILDATGELYTSFIKELNENVVGSDNRKYID
jgi:outer membrane protein, adhesin transport system